MQAASLGARVVGIDSELPPVRVPIAVWNELCAHAREAAAPPDEEECCGLLVGDRRVRYRRVYRCQNVAAARHAEDPTVYPRNARTGFVMNEADYLAAQGEAEAAAQQVTAVYHSHVDFGVYLSELDLECIQQPYFPFPDADQIVIGVLDGSVRGMGLFARRAQGGFEGRALAPEPTAAGGAGRDEADAAG